MQTPAGFGVGPDGRMFPTDYWQVVFNPSVFVRVPHMVLASYLSVAFIVGAVGAVATCCTAAPPQRCAR